MADLGEFGRARVAEHEGETEPDVFRFYGVPFTLQPRISSLVLMEFAHDAKVNQDADAKARLTAERARARLSGAVTPAVRALAEEDIRAAEVAAQAAETASMTSIYRYVRACIGDDQWDAFRDVVLREGVDVDELLLVSASIFEAVAARPTRRPSDSSGGPSSTGDGSTDAYASPAPTPGPAPVVMGEVVPMPTAAERQALEFDRLMVPVDPSLIRSSG